MAKRKELDESTVPPMHSPEWQDYCMALFNEDELRDGCPNVAGLRRVSELVIGPIVDMQHTFAEGPKESNGWSAMTVVRIGFASQDMGRDVYFAGEADCIPGDEGNCEPAFARFPSAMADTRARARAFRNALRLNKVAAEECTSLPVVERKQPERDSNKIKDYQVNGIINQCRVLDIDPLKLINQYGSNYGCVDEMTKDGGQKALKLLNAYHQNRSTIPDSIKL